MEDMIPCALKDQEVFQRVWQRVMAGRPEDSSPIRPGPSGGGDVSCQCLKDLMRQDGEGLPQSCRSDGDAAPPEAPPMEEAPAPQPPGPPAGDLPPQEGNGWGGDLPALWEEPQGGDDRAARLRRHVMDALEGWQFYRHLARRARGTDARALNALAGELHKHARKLSAAYFLLTGLCF